MELDIPIELQTDKRQSRSKQICVPLHKTWRKIVMAVRENSFPPFQLQLSVNNTVQPLSILVSSTLPIEDFDFPISNGHTVELVATPCYNLGNPVTVTVHFKANEE